MPSLGFLRNKWPKRHEFLVEQCQALHVSEVLPYLHRLNLKLTDDLSHVPGIDAKRSPNWA